MVSRSRGLCYCEGHVTQTSVESPLLVWPKLGKETREEKMVPGEEVMQEAGRPAATRIQFSG